MTADKLSANTRIELTAAHLLVVWDVLANRLSDTACIKELPDEERRAIWALQDMCEAALSKIGLDSRPESEWNALMASARKHVSKIPVQFLD